MTAFDEPPPSRRAFLRFLAGSPLLSLLGLPACADRGTGRRESAGMSELEELVTSADEAINVFDLEAVARATLPPAHWGYLATGVDDDRTVRANREGLARLYLRPRRLVGVRNVDCSVELFGERWETPIFLCPVSSQRAFHPEGEAGTARAAASRGHLQLLSTVSSTSVEDVAAARGAPVWYQLYPTSDWNATQGLLRRAEGAGSPVVVLTVDLPVGSNRETAQRFRRRDTRDCSVCHQPGRSGFLSKPMFEGLEVNGGLMAPGLTWDFIGRLKDTTSMRVVVKGIVTREDAARCVRYGADGIVVSNHGGRAEESGRATIASLVEVVEAVRGRIPVLVDGGIRRGNDVLKALALGATAVGIGRPQAWGLAAFGQVGVERVLDILRSELELAMRLAGAPTIADIDRSLVASA
jgi:isopentenyl diphosphate isomerase/L-lactate dehydrogenase-like FMN-dependent dehydrogenase